MSASTWKKLSLTVAWLTLFSVMFAQTGADRFGPIVSALRDREFDKALQLLEPALKENQQNPQLRVFQGLAYSGRGDQKAALDLNARIASEEAMLQNEQTKLQGLYQVAQSQEWARAQAAREQAIADQGSLRQLPAMGL